MIARTRKAGNSLAITIPKEAVEAYGLREGDYIDIRFNKVTMQPEMRPHVRAAFEEIRQEYAEGFEYLKEK
ncbi:MAG TPA: AbrB/MazE/SpoVT family DNA-binding domain-containing protein [Chloroflexota bacterium]|nr:AbrB/MazE/SpoVT family DNA-binding domain-containing protein [Chloroflexota bacterium]